MQVPATVSIVFIAAIARSCYSLAEPVAVMVGPDTALATPYDTGESLNGIEGCEASSHNGIEMTARLPVTMRRTDAEL